MRQNVPNEKESQWQPQPLPHPRGIGAGLAVCVAPLPPLTLEAKTDISRARFWLPHPGHSACGSLRVTRASNEF